MNATDTYVNNLIEDTAPNLHWGSSYSIDFFHYKITIFHTTENRKLIFSVYDDSVPRYYNEVEHLGVGDDGVYEARLVTKINEPFSFVYDFPYITTRHPRKFKATDVRYDLFSSTVMEYTEIEEHSVETPNIPAIKRIMQEVFLEIQKKEKLPA